MIGGTNGGAGGLNLRVVGSNTQPVHPVDNMIWLNTETAIPHWYFQNTAPSNPKRGDVYITETTTASHVLQILRNNGLKLYFGTARQYNGSSWEVVGGKIYYNGAWHNLQTFVYDGSIGNAENNFNHNIGGYPWVRSGYATAINAAADSFSCVFGSNYPGSGLCRSNLKIDLTGVNKVKITFSSSGEGRVVTKQARAFSDAGGGGVVASVTAASGSKTTVELNVASLTGSYYIGFFADSDASVGNWWHLTYRIYTIELVS